MCKVCLCAVEYQDFVSALYFRLHHLSVNTSPLLNLTVCVPLASEKLPGVVFVDMAVSVVLALVVELSVIHVS